jgi:hypothetical protein
VAGKARQPDIRVLEDQFQGEPRIGRRQHALRGSRDLGPDAVAGHDQDAHRRLSVGSPGAARAAPARRILPPGLAAVQRPSRRPDVPAAGAGAAVPLPLGGRR